jgi:predicted nucleic acid-binding protein
VLTLYLQKSMLTFSQAYAIQTEAKTLLSHREYDVESFEELRLAEESRCSGYDYEFVALAKHLGVPLVTSDRKALRFFPSFAVSLTKAAS